MSLLNTHAASHSNISGINVSFGIVGDAWYNPSTLAFAAVVGFGDVSRREESGGNLHSFLPPPLLSLSLTACRRH